jgi:large subunit ribosomal protein L25
MKVSARPRAGKGAARAARRDGLVPGVIYGGDERTAEAIAVDYLLLTNTLKKGRFFASVFDLDVDGKKVRAIPRAVQLDPVKDFPIHVDFQRIGSDNRVRLMIPMRFINEALSPGLKRGGVLNIVRREVEVWCPADRIPDHFEASLEGLEIGRSIHISAVKMPEGVRPTITDRDFTVATIAGAAAMKPEFDETATTAGAEGAEGAAPAAGAAAAPAAGDAKDAKAAPAKDAKAAPAKDEKKK